MSSKSDVQSMVKKAQGIHENEECLTEAARSIAKDIPKVAYHIAAAMIDEKRRQEV